MAHLLLGIRQTYTDQFYETALRGSLMSAEVIVPLVLGLVHPQSVVDAGCGVGTWLSVFQKYGVKKILGLDGNYVPRPQLLITEKDFQAVDLAEPFQIPQAFDLAISLEVGEHIPGKKALNFVKSISKLAPLVLFSAAVPAQGGAGHVNEQWPPYWKALFGECDFTMFDPIRKLLWGNEGVCYWYRQNIFMFARNDLIDDKPEIRQLVQENKPCDLWLVHPVIVDGASGLRYFLRRLPKTIRRRVLRLSV